MPELSVLLSSTLRDLERERKRLHKAIESRKLHAIGMERYRRSNPKQITAEFCEELARTADVYVGVLAWSYGSIAPKRNKSYTEIELDTALAAGKECHVFIIKGNPGDAPHKAFDDGPDGHEKSRRLDQLKARVKENSRICWYPYEDLESLADGVHEALSIWLRRTQSAPAVAEHESAIDDPAIQRYLRAAIGRYGRVELSGFDSDVRGSFSLSRIYVEPRGTPDERLIFRTHYRNVKEACSKLVARGNSQDLPMGKAFLAAWKRGKRRSIVVLGEARSGMTTFLKNIFMTLAERRGDRLGRGLTDAVPIFLPLSGVVRGEGSLEALLELQLKDLQLERPAELRQRLLAAPRLVFLLDGLDEVPDKPARLNRRHRELTNPVSRALDRASVLNWLATIEQNYPNSRTALTCRIASFPHEQKIDANPLLLYLRPLDLDRIGAFIDKWFRAVAIHTKGGCVSALARGRVRSKRLNSQIRGLRGDSRGRRILELIENPQLLTAICLESEDYKRSLMLRRVELFENCIRTLARARRTDLERKVETKMAGRSRSLLEAIAWFLHKHGDAGSARFPCSGATKPELEKVIELELARLKAPPAVSARRCLAEICDDSGLITKTGDGRVAFLFRGIQEYLAAQYVRRRASAELLDRSKDRRESETLDEVSSHCGNPDWDELILLLLATDGTDVLCARDELFRYVEAKAAGGSLKISFLQIARAAYALHSVSDDGEAFGLGDLRVRNSRPE